MDAAHGNPHDFHDTPRDAQPQSEPLPDVAPPRPPGGAGSRLGPGAVLRTLLFVVRLVLALLGAAIILLVALYFLRPDLLYEWARLRLITIATGIAGLPVEIDEMSGPLWKEIYLDGFRVRSSTHASSTVFARVHQVTIRPHWLNVFSWNGPLVTVLLDNGYADIRLDPKGNPNVQPSGTGGGGHANLPLVELQARNLVVSFWDQNRYFGFRTWWRVDQARGKIHGNDLRLGLGAYSSRQKLEHVDFDLNLDNKAGTIAMDYSALEPKILNYILKNPNARILSGTASGAIKLGWTGTRNVKLTIKGQTDILNARIYVKQLPVPLERVNGHINLDTKQITLVNTRLRVAGMPLTVGGTLSDFMDKHPTVNMQASSGAVDLQQLGVLAPALRKQHLAGIGNFKARITGSMADPLVQGVAGLPSTQYQGLPITGIQAWFRFQRQRLQVPMWQAHTLQGTVQGQSQVDLKGKGSLNTRVKWEHLSVPAAMDFLHVRQDRRMPVSGFLFGRAEVNGPLAQPQVVGLADVQGGRVGNWRATTAHAAFRVRGRDVEVPQMLADFVGPSSGEWLKLVSQVSPGGALQARVAGQGVPLGELAAFAPPLKGATGTISLAGVVTGNYRAAQRDWTTLHGNGDVHLRNAVIFEQPLDRADTNWQLADGQLLLPQVRAIRRETWLSASGAINLRRMMAAQGKYAVQLPPSTIVAERLQHLDRTLHDAIGQQVFAALPPFMTINNLKGVIHMQDVPAASKKGGVTAGVLTVQGQGGVDAAGFTFSSSMELTNLVTPRASVEKIATKLTFDHTRLYVPQLTISQADDQYRAQGWLDVLGRNRHIDMNGKITNGHVPTMLSIVGQTYMSDTFAESGVTEMIRRGLTSMDMHLPQTEDHQHFTLADQTQRIRADQFTAATTPGVTASARQTHYNTALEYQDEFSLPPAFATSAAGVPPWWQEIDGVFNAEVKAVGPLDTPTATVKLDLTQGRVYNHNVDHLTVNSTYVNQQFQLHSVAVQEGPDMQVNGNGVIGRDGKAVIDLQADNLDLDWANPWIAPYGLALNGKSKWTIALTGSLQKPTVVLDTQVSNGTFQQGDNEPVRFDQVTALSRFDNGILDMTQGTIQVGDKRVTMGGIMPITNENAQYDFVANLKDDAFSLISLFTKDIQWLGGKGQAVVNLKGTKDQPYFLGSVDLNDAKLLLPAVGDPLEHVQARVTLHSDQEPPSPNQPAGLPPEHVDYINVDNFKAKLNGGDLSVDGTMELLSLKPLYFGMREAVVPANQPNVEVDQRRQYIHVSGTNLHLKQMAMYQGQADLDLRLRGLVAEPVLLGAVTLTHGVIDASASGGNVDPKAEKASASSGPAMIIRFDRSSPLVVTVGEDMWVKSALGTALVGDMSLQPLGTILIKGSSDVPRMEGVIDLKRGHLNILNQRFNVTKGQVNFDSVTGINPNIAGPLATINPLVSLEVQGKVSNPYASAGGDTTVVLVGKISGRLQDLQNKDRLQIEWTDKGNLSDSQVMAILARQAELQAVMRGEIAQSLLRELTPFLSSYLLGPLSSQLEEFTGFDEFTLGAESDPRATNLGNLDIGLSLTLTKTLVKDFSISYSGFFGTHSFNDYSLRYKALRFLSLVYKLQQESGQVIHSAGVETGLTF